MDFNDQLSQHYSEMLDGTYECADRIVLNGYYKQCHHPGGFRMWWRTLKGSDDDLDKNNLMRAAKSLRSLGVPLLMVRFKAKY